ncbi:MAG: NnrU family protein [Panacagrimonas sp.]
MLLLVAGLLLWTATHLFSSLGRNARASVVARIGLNPYKGLYSLMLVLALVLIVLGWRSIPPISVWLPPAGMRHLAMVLVPIAVILFISARAPTDIKQFIRHPQLTSVKLWAVAHLLTNGEQRSIVLFGGLLAWAVLEVIFINRRDGARVKPPRVGMARTVVTALIGLLVAAVLIVVHPWIAGRPVMVLG